ncbi:hypothetical protein COV93_08025 [Candidatus Woesearchaeota archaeon CG11_big_fil_rev_8_21_14_0_20_43_8]|nr:MAG: hypothetical protein COV93_08025 [Candidatus Woesearchaeota archaeon CG11_big_fil_rev_8_21_14_0_20_43_8]
MSVNDDYYHALDRGYSPIGDIYGSLPSDKTHQSGDIASDSFAGLSPKLIGISAPPMKDQLESLKSRIFQGASKVELGFWGKGKGSMGQGSTNPEMYDKEMRQAIKELATINEINTSTHVAPAIGNWSGLGQDRFSEAERESNLREAKKTIDFAADVTSGGAVVIHTGEFPRSIWENFKDENFQMYGKEKDESIHYLVDPRTGQIISGVKNNEVVYMPEIEKEADGSVKYLKDVDGNYVKNEYGENIGIYKVDKSSNMIQVNPITFAKYAEQKRAEGWEKTDDIVKEFFKEQQMVQVDHATGQAKYFGDGYHRGMKDWEELKENIEDLRYMQEKLSPEQFKHFARDFAAQKLHHRLEEDEDVFKIIDERSDQVKRTFAYGRESLLSGVKQAKEIIDRVNRAQSIKEFALDRSTDSISELGMYVWTKTMAKKKVEPGFHDLFISPENIFPESFGAHPRELKEIVLKSREKMVEQLKARKISEGEAKKLAEKHIKATFDIGHAYIWRKYYQGKDEDFNDWLMDQVDDLTKDKIIGHVHVSDNFGYEDEHVTPGLGKVPIKEFIDKMKKAGVTDLVVEPAHQDYKAMLGGWRSFGSSIYSVSKPGITRDRWTDIENSYFGHVGPPQYIVGDYSPSQDFRGAPFYSGVPFE